MMPAMQAAGRLDHFAVAHAASTRAGTRPSVLIGLVGRGIRSSRSPIMHEREGARLGLHYSYVLIDFDELGLPDAALADIVEEAERLGFAGLNITHPFKQAVVAVVSDLSPEAAAIGAINTIVLSGGRRIGHNTDCWGFAESFRDGVAARISGSVVQFGAGGGGAAVAHALLELGVAELDIVDPDVSRARTLAENLSARFAAPVLAVTDNAAAMRRAAGVVNATPIGMAKYPGMPFAEALLRSDHWVADIIYFPPETELLRVARQRGCRTLAGTGMAVYQAVKAFELFTGIAADRAAMAGHFGAAT